MAEEIWKDIPGIIRYEASSEGRIRERETHMIVKEISPGTVVIHPGSIGDVEWKVCKLIAKAFLEKPKSRSTLNFINGNPDDCRACNLEWAKVSTNCKSVIKYDTNWNLLREYPSARAASRDTGVSYQGIILCCTNHQKQSGGFYWRYRGKGRNRLIGGVPDLMKCPCCEGTAEMMGSLSGDLEVEPYNISMGDSDYKFSVMCQNCGLTTRRFGTLYEAADSWNTRPKAEAVENKPEKKVEISDGPFDLMSLLDVDDRL